MKQLAGKPFALLGVHGFDYPSAKLKAVMDKEQLNWRSLSSRAIATRWSARGTPTYYIIDPNGVIQFKWVGYPGSKAIDDDIDSASAGAVRRIGRGAPNHALHRMAAPERQLAIRALRRDRHR